jgi:hypothetical protein
MRTRLWQSISQYYCTCHYQKKRSKPRADLDTCHGCFTVKAILIFADVCFDIFASCKTQSLALLTPSHTDTIDVFGNPRSRLSFCGTSVLDWVTCSSSSRLAKRGSECPATFAVFLLDQQLPIKWRFQFLLQRAVAQAARFPYTIGSSRHRLPAFYRTSAARSYLQSCNLGSPAELLSPCILRR